MNKAKKDIENCKNKEELEKLIIHYPGYVLITLKTVIAKKLKEFGLIHVSHSKRIKEKNK